MSGKGVSVGRWEIPDGELDERFDTAGGPGGQHANRSRTAVTIRFDLASSSLPDDVRERAMRRLGSVIEVTASESRSQWRNRSIARKRLASRIEGALVEPTIRKRTKPTRRSHRKRLEEKRARGRLKESRKPPETE